MTLLTAPQRNMLHWLARARWVHLSLALLFLVIAASAMFLEWLYTPRLADYLWTGAALMMAAAEAATYCVMSLLQDLFREHM